MQGLGSLRLEQRASRWLEGAAKGRLGEYVAPGPLTEIGSGDPLPPEDSQSTVVVPFRLQAISDYRAAIRAWFKLLRIGGHLVIVVPHAFLYERQLALPSRWNIGHRRLYTPGALLDEIEEALEPNSYRVRHLSDQDANYDYTTKPDEEPSGEADVVVVVERVEQPTWQPLVTAAEASAVQRREALDYQFETPKTRVEVETVVSCRKLLLLKLDHLGDFIMGIAAIERVRAVFVDAEITLVVGSWNAEMAQQIGLADKVIAFDAFPRNSSEEEVDVPGKAALFQQTITEEYDIVIDLRVDTDTRQLLRLVKAKQRAGIGTRAQFRFLDIFLPLDFTRNEPETARETLLNHFAFSCQGSAKRTEHQVLSSADSTERDCAIVWGPYHALRPGRYFFEPHIDVPDQQSGLVLLDIALDATRVAQHLLDGPGRPRLSFTVEEPGLRFEFRIWSVDGARPLGLSFFGGRLVREGASSVLHQVEYMLLLVELVALRLTQTGILADLSA